MRFSRPTRRFWGFALALALITAQWAAQLHSFEHARYELALAARGMPLPLVEVEPPQAFNSSHDASHDSHGLPKLDHSRDHCVVFQGMDCSLVSLVLPVLYTPPPADYLAEVRLDYRPVTTPPFSSRAPPVFS